MYDTVSAVEAVVVCVNDVGSALVVSTFAFSISIVPIVTGAILEVTVDSMR